jgi:hypothetical protein
MYEGIDFPLERTKCESAGRFHDVVVCPAGAGKSAIAKRMAELAAEKRLLVGTSYFSSTTPTRNTQDRLIATLAYHFAVAPLYRGRDRTRLISRHLSEKHLNPNR